MIDIERALQIIKDRRQEMGISQATIAEDLNLTTSGYRKIENGQSPLSLDRFIKICHLLAISPNKVLDGISETSSKDLLVIENKRLSSELDYLREEINYQRELNNKLLQLLNPKYVDLVVS